VQLPPGNRFAPSPSSGGCHLRSLDLLEPGIPCINTAATDAIKSSSDEDLKKGYAGCIANLYWLR
jgi:hypothetical protein